MDLAVAPVRSPAEFERLHRLIVEYERDLPLDLRHGREPSLAEVERRYGGQNAAFLARIGSEYGGCVAVTELDGTSAVLQRLYVEPAYRGHGAARALAAAAIGFARERGYRRIVFDTDRARLQAAYALYLSLGFSDCEPYAAVDYESPTYMELKLG